MAFEGAGYAASYSTLLFIVVIVSALMFGGGGSGALTFVKSGSFSLLTTVLGILPFVILAYGIFADVTTLQFRYTIASIAGLDAIIISLIGSFVFGKFLPTFVASSAAVLTYYTYDYIVKHATTKPFLAIFVTLFNTLVLAAQTMTTAPSPAGTFLFKASLMNDGLATALGVSVGLSTWLGTYLASPEKLPYSSK
jgi:hypothetical protein